MTASRLILPGDDLDPMLDGIPRILGYGAVAVLTPRRGNDNRVTLNEEGFVPLASSTISSYYYECMKPKRRSWVYIPRPDFILLRGDNRPALPGWTLQTIGSWQATRPGVGNRARGAERLAQRTTSSGEPGSAA